MTEEHRAPDEDGATNEFSTVRKGYDPAEVEKYLAEYDEAFRDLEEYAARLKRELHDAKLEIARLHAAEQDSIDAAMLAVFDAKDRIIQGAQERARQIEETARARAGTPHEPEPEVAVPEAAIDESAGEPPSDSDEPVAGPPSVVAQPTDVLQQMLQEAESIRNRLDDGLAAAFDQMDQMQRDAELRAAALLADARREASRIAAVGSASTEPTIAVSLTDRATSSVRPSRYSRNSARLPRIGDEDGSSIMASMNSLRTRMREGEDAAEDGPVPTHDATG